MWAVKVRSLKLNVFWPRVLIILHSAISRRTVEFRSWKSTQFYRTAICTRKTLRQIGVNDTAANVNAHESLNNMSRAPTDTNKTGNVLQPNNGGAFFQQLLQTKSNNYCVPWMYFCSLRYPACNAHVPYCHPWPFRLYKMSIFHLIKDNILEEKSYWTK
jgi:hypothetical protein